MSDRFVRRLLKPLVFASSRTPAAVWAWNASSHQLNANPFNAIVRDTGFWSLRLLCLTVATTPLRWVTGWHVLVRFRRMLGLFAFLGHDSPRAPCVGAKSICYNSFRSLTRPCEGAKR